MEVWKKFIQDSQSILDKIIETQGDRIKEAAEIVAETTRNEGLIHVFGAGHSHIVASEVHWRAGTLANVHSIIESSIAGSPTEITKASYIEKLEGLGQILVDYHKLESKDCVIVISNSGNNAVTIDFAKASHEKGIKVIGLTAVEYSDYLKPLHSSGKKMKDFCDVVLDNCTPIGDALIEIEGLPMKVGGSSTSPFIMLIQSVLVQATYNLAKEGITPDVYYNGNLGANFQEVYDHNNQLIDKYFNRIRNL